MNRILDVLKGVGINCMPTNRREIEGDDQEVNTPLPQMQEWFENPVLESGYTNELPALDTKRRSMFRYFLDGSRRVFSIADVVFERKYYPILVGQIGVGVIERHDDLKLRPVSNHCKIKNLVAFPDAFPKSDLDVIQKKLNENRRFNFHVAKYQVKRDDNLTDLGIAKIMKEMHDMEIETVCDLTDNGFLTDERMLVIDGGLQFVEQKFEREQFKDVVAIAKTFQVNWSAGKGKKKYDIGALAKRLDYGDRTIALSPDFGRYKIGNWYLKMRPKKYMNGPMQGVAKVEVYAANPYEEENGIDQSRISNISKCILSERNVTLYGKDARWAVHLYPMYQVEQYLKSRFVSTAALMGAF